MKDLMLFVHVVVKTFNSEISRCHLADYVKEFYYSACCTIIFTHSTNHFPGVANAVAVAVVLA